MKLQFHISSQSEFPLRGFLIRETSPSQWIMALQGLGFKADEVRLLPVPGTTPNSIWACLVIVEKVLTKEEVGKYELFQEVFPNLFIPAGTRISPDLTPRDRERLFPTGAYCFHPEVGLAELDASFRIADLIELPEKDKTQVRTPSAGENFPDTIQSFQVIPLPPEELMEKMGKKALPPKEVKEDKALSPIEQIRLFLYENLFLKSKVKSKSKTGQNKELRGWAKKLFSRLGRYKKPGGSVEEQVLNDYEDLADRNRKELDKLLDLLDKKPDEALYYAIPLDDQGTGRGHGKSAYRFGKRWWHLNLEDERGYGSGSGVMNSSYNQLSQKYRKMAADFQKKREYEKAAFVYLKLLKDPQSAAGALKEGKMYQEAAVIYEGKCNNQAEAANCYEKGKMYEKAIELYKRVGKMEYVGDLYQQLGKEEESQKAYEAAANDYLRQKKYLLAARVYREKIKDLDRGQTTLHTGWKKGDQKARHCLDQYLGNIPDLTDKKREIRKVLQEDVNDANSKVFLTVILKEYVKRNDLESFLREMSYELIAYRAKGDPGVLKFLKTLNPENREAVKDIVRFKTLK